MAHDSGSSRTRCSNASARPRLRPTPGRGAWCVTTRIPGSGRGSAATNMAGIDQAGTLTDRLAGRSLKVIGLGGIGTPVAQALAQFLGASAPTGATLFLIDGDSFEEKNRARVAYQNGGNKAISKADELA